MAVCTCNLTFHLLIFLTSAAISAAELTPQELEAALSALRFRGYNLFPNSVTTSDIVPLLLSFPPNSSYTLFSPPDHLLFCLDLSSSAATYTASLHLHVSSLRRTASDLRSLPYFASIDTLLPDHRLSVGKALVKQNATILGSVTLDGVRISAPDLFVGPNIVVHGIQGIFLARHDPGSNDDFGEAPRPSSCEMCLPPQQSWVISPPVESLEQEISPPALVGSPNPDMRTPVGSQTPETQELNTNMREFDGNGAGSGCHRFFRFSRRFTLN